MRACSRCVLPEVYPGISFDEEGVCNYCRERRPPQYQGEEALWVELSKYRGAGRDYDCLVPVSGGRDSVFVLTEVVRRSELRVAAFHYENGFQVSVAKKNVERATETLEVPLLTVRSRFNAHAKCVRDNIEHFAHVDPLEVAGRLCYGCSRGYQGAAYQTAKRHGVPVVVFGASAVEESLYKKIVFAPYKSTAAKKFGFLLGKPIFLLHYLVLLTQFPLVEQKKDVAWVNFFEYVPWNEQRILDTIEKEVGWQSHPELTSTWRFDCLAHAALEHLTERLLGFGEKEEFYSVLIREGQLTRQEALRRLEAHRADEPVRHKLMEEFFAVLGLPEKYREYIRTGGRFSTGPSEAR